MLALLLLGVLLASFALLLALRPQLLLMHLWRTGQSGRWAVPLIILAGLLASLLLIFSAVDTRFPTAVKVCGYLLAGTAVGLMFLPPERHARLLDWIFNGLERRPRALGAGLLLIAALLLYAAA